MGKGIKRDALMLQVSLGMDGGTWTMGLWVQNIALKLAMFQWVLCFGAHVAHASKPMLGRLKINNAFMTCH
jgi:hypothetical protein